MKISRKTWGILGAAFFGCTTLWLNDLAQHGWNLPELAKDYSAFFATIGTALHVYEYHKPRLWEI